MHTVRFTVGWEVHAHPSCIPPSPSPSQSSSPPSTPPSLAHTLLSTQARLTQIVKMMHTASLLHDVIDGSPLHRGFPSAPDAFTPKLTVLGGNFVLGCASVALARLGESLAHKLITSILANLVEGSILQLHKVKVGNNLGAANNDADPVAASPTGSVGALEAKRHKDA